MSTVLLSAFFAMALNAQSGEMKKDTVDTYLIDKQKIEHFVGTQLEGKTISKYIIAYKTTGEVVERIHVIMTTPPKVVLNGDKAISADNPLRGKIAALIVMDGKETSSEQLSKVNPDDIVSVNVYKPGSKVAKSYGEKGEKGVIVVVTKAGNLNDDIIYFIDGKKTTKQEVDRLSPDQIASITVNKKDGVGVLEITTKK